MPRPIACACTQELSALPPASPTSAAPKSEDSASDKGTADPPGAAATAGVVMAARQCDTGGTPASGDLYNLNNEPWTPEHACCTSV